MISKLLNNIFSNCRMASEEQEDALSPDDILEVIELPEVDPNGTGELGDLFLENPFVK